MLEWRETEAISNGAPGLIGSHRFRDLQPATRRQIGPSDAMDWKRSIASMLAVAASVSAIGLASAWYSLAACEDAVFQDTQRRDVRGIDFSGQVVRLSRDDISARIVGPILVEVRYSLPRDMHGSIYTTRFIVFFGYRQRRSSDVFHLVGPPASSGSGTAS